MRYPVVLAALLITAAPFTAGVAGETWPEFRGPNGVGVATDVDLPAEFGDERNVVWKTAIPGWGHSSPVVWGDQIWMTTATEDGLQMSAVAVDAATGAILHNVLLFENDTVGEGHHESNSFASGSPVIEQGRVYCHFGHYGTACLDTTSGDVVWQRRDIDVDEFRGPASSPIIFENLLIIHFDGIDRQFVMAFDKATGETVWRTVRDIDFGTDVGDQKKGFGTPGVFTIDGRKQLVSPTAVETITYDPRTGQEIWRVRHGGMNAAARPLYAHGLVYIAAGKDDSKIVAVSPGTGDLTESGVAWKSGRQVSTKASPLVIGDLLFMVTDDGIATCRDARTGTIYWRERLAGDYWASPVSDGEKIFAFSKDGVVPVFAVSKEFKLLAENRFDEGFHSTPAIADNAMFLRSRHHLYRIEKR